MDDLLSAWSIGGPWNIQAAIAGGNNLSYPFSTPDGRYVLRIYQNTADPDRVRYEHALLTRLQQAGLSFAVPAPLPTRSGSTLVPVLDGSGRQLAALFPLLPGRHPDGGDPGERRICGAALAELDQALSGISIPALPGILPPFGQLAHIHPAVPDPLEMLKRVPLEPPQRARLTRIVEDVAATVPALYRALPQQIIHRDFDASNVLMEGDHVTGVLDFEFAGPDLRALDLARSLSLFTISPWSSPRGWRWVAAFADGYRERVELRPDEVDELPDMIRLHRAMSLIHREGRRRQGLASDVDVAARATALLQGDKWLRERRQDLVKALLGG